MRRIDKLISYAMWVSIVISSLVIGIVVHERLYKWDWRYTVALCLLWVPPALCLGQLDDIPGSQSSWFYRFAILTLLWGAAVAACGFFLFDVQD